MKKLFSTALLAAFALLASASTEDDAFVKRQCLESLVQFMQYARDIYTDCGVNARGDSIGYFKAKDAGRSSEDGVRTNADLAMVAAFVYETGRKEDVSLPAGLTYPQLRRMAIRSFRYALSTHRANQLFACTDQKHWGSDTKHHQWESSLWALSVAMAGEFIDQGWGLTSYERQQLERLLASESDFQLTRKVPTGYIGDSKAEENGWEANVLAAACAFCPDHPNIGKWREAMLRYGFNCYTVAADANDTTFVAGRQARQWFEGQNLYDDFTLQNHNYFHTSYQNVVMQEQAECLVALALGEDEQPKDLADARKALTWHWSEVWNMVLAQLALSDGELAMPNGNDWSMFLYDQLPAYAAMATLLGNSDALMLEERCLSSLRHRQLTTSDGSYMLNPDIGPRRMGVTAHRVMMTYLMHDLFATEQLQASSWSSFQQRHAAARLLPCQQVVRSMTKERFSSLSWSEGLKNCTAIIVPNQEENSKVFIPFKNGFGGNIMGIPQAMLPQPTFMVDSTEWVAYAQGATSYCVWATPGNAVIAIADPNAKDACMMALSMDPLTTERRTIHLAGAKKFTADGKQRMSFGSQWANIDDVMSVVSTEHTKFSLEKRELVNSIWTSRLVPQHNMCVYFSNVTAAQTSHLARGTKQWEKNGWIVVQTHDTDNRSYLLAFNPGGATKRFKLPRKLKKMKHLTVKIVDNGTVK
ncbi:MAG: hypothetical protein K5893_04565 [Prevotella sp.]|nr:hypothetical protein [Prevotella sp.]